MKPRKMLAVYVVLLMILTLACGISPKKEEVDEGATITAIAMEVHATQTAVYTPPPPTPTDVPEPATEEPTEAPPPSTEATPGGEVPLPSGGTPGGKVPLPGGTPSPEAETTPGGKVPLPGTTPGGSPSPEAEATTEAKPTVSVPSTSSGKGVIAYTKFDGEHSLWMAKTDGSGETFLLQHAASPSWSPEAARLAFFGKPGIDTQKDGWVFGGLSDGVMSILPTGDLTQMDLWQYVGDGTARWVDWGPDGSMLAYDARHGGDWRIYFLGTADNEQYIFEIPGEQPTWSDDSQKVVYRSCRDNKCGIWISNRDDSDPHSITGNGSDSFPAWSPLGDKIAFHREQDGNVDIYVMNVDGTGVTQLTDAQGQDTLPTWSPDGKMIYFKSARSGKWDIFSMSADGSNQQVVISDVGMGDDWAFDKLSVR
jgi:TolB protein